MKTVDSWFSFESRCLLCGGKFSDTEIAMVGRHTVHLQRHIREGYLNEELEQIKAHPVGFPGPPLGQHPPCFVAGDLNLTCETKSQ